MENHVPKKIHIIGSVGSGKTTLAKVLSAKYHIPYYELDNVVWKRHHSGDIRRNEQERDEFLHQIIQRNAWIIEGVHHQWVLPSFQTAELIIFLDTNYKKRIYRILKRFIRQKSGLEEANYIPTFKIFKKMFSWNASFERTDKAKILYMLKPYNNKLLIIKDNTEINKYIK